MTHETAAAINAVSQRLTDVEQKLDNYFKQLYDENSTAIDEIIISVLEGGVSNEE